MKYGFIRFDNKKTLSFLFNMELDDNQEKNEKYLLYQSTKTNLTKKGIVKRNTYIVFALNHNNTNDKFDGYNLFEHSRMEQLNSANNDTIEEEFFRKRNGNCTTHNNNNTKETMATNVNITRKENQNTTFQYFINIGAHEFKKDDNI